MNKLKTGLIGGLTGILLAAATIFPSKAQEIKIRDGFKKPYSTELAIEHNYPELSTLEKITYLQDKLASDTSRAYIKKIPGALCGNYVGQMWTNFTGDSTLNPEEIPFNYYFDENGKQNIQTFSVEFAVNGYFGHMINGFTINDTLTNINSFYFYDNSRAKRVYLDSLEKNNLDYEINPAVPITISYINGFNPAGFPKTDEMLKFDYINGYPILTYKNPVMVLTNPALDNEAPITQYSFTDTITTNPDDLILTYNFQDGEYLETKRYGTETLYYDYDFYSGHFLDSGYFEIDNQGKNYFDFSQELPFPFVTYSNPVYHQSGEIPLDKSQGKHQVIVSVTDYGYPGNTTTDTINYEVDTTNTIIEPQAEKLFKVYPNPVVDYLKIEGIEKGEMRIYNIAGKQLEKRLLEGEEINMANYKPGMYILRIEDSKGKVYTSKVIKK